MRTLSSIKLNEGRRKLVQHLILAVDRRKWTPALIRSLTFLPSLHHLGGAWWPLPLGLDNAMKGTDRIKLRSLKILLPGPDDNADAPLLTADLPPLSTFIDPSALTTLCLDGRDSFLVHCLEQGRLKDFVNLQHLRIDVDFTETNAAVALAHAAGIEQRLLSFTIAHGSQLKRFFLHFRSYDEVISAYSFNYGLLSSLPNAELISLSNASTFKQPFPPLPLLRTLYLGTFGWLEFMYPADMDQPELPQWCLNLPTLQSLLTNLAGMPIPKHGLPKWTSDQLPRLEEIGDWSVDWGESNPMTDVQLEYTSWALNQVGLSFVDKYGRRRHTSFGE